MGFLLFLFISITSLGQNGFIVVDTDSFPRSWNNYSFQKLFSSPENVVELIIQPSEMDSIMNYSPGKLLNLRTIAISFVYDPGYGDSLRVPFTDQVVKHMGQLSCFSKCTGLTAIYFSIGEQVFLSDREKKDLPEKITKKGQDKNMTQRTKLNIDNAWKAFGLRLQKDLPGVKLYVYEWGW